MIGTMARAAIATVFGHPMRTNSKFIPANSCFSSSLDGEGSDPM
jgi:hypothetical protein